VAERFDEFLAAALAPAERQGDRKFVARVQAAIALEERLAAQRRSLLTELAQQLVAVAAGGVAVWWIGRAEPVASHFAQSPALCLAILLTGFGLLVALMSSRRPVAAEAYRH
jgi:hypothetical protein